MNGRDKVNNDDPGRFISPSYVRAQHKQRHQHQQEQVHSSSNTDRDKNSSIDIFPFTYSETSSSTDSKPLASPPPNSIGIDMNQPKPDQFAVRFIEQLSQLQTVDIDNFTEGQVTRLLEQFWGFDNAEDVIEQFTLKRIARRHNRLIKRARQRGLDHLGSIENPAGYFTNVLKGRKLK